MHIDNLTRELSHLTSALKDYRLPQLSSFLLPDFSCVRLFRDLNTTDGTEGLLHITVDGELTCKLLACDYEREIDNTYQQ